MRRLALAAVPFLFTALVGCSAHAVSPPVAAALRVADFTLTDATTEKPVSLGDFKGKKAVVVAFIGTECPINNAYMPRLAELAKAYADKGVQFLGVNSNCNDTPPRIAGHAAKVGLPFPVLRDAANVVADQFSAKRTPEVFVLDPDGRVLYQGRIDDQFGVGYKRDAPPAATSPTPSTRCSPASRCRSRPRRRPAASSPASRNRRPTAASPSPGTLSRVLQKNCQECHRPGQVGPMPLLTYEDALAWSDTIREVVEQKRMPPWLADPHFGTFQNDRSLSAEDRATLLGWLDQGCPKGDLTDLPPAREFAEGWSIGKPDAVFTMPDEFTVPASTEEKGLKYQYFIARTKFTEDRWVQAAEAKPGNRAVVHHIIVFVVKPGKDGGLMREKTGDGIGDGFLTAYAPGELSSALAPGTAKRIPKNSLLVFQMHYTPNGVEQNDQSCVGLIFAKEPPKIEVRTRAIAQKRLNIPPGEANYEAKSETVFDQDADLLSLLPHMHLRGKDFLL